MGLIVVGLSHKTAPVEQREKAALTEPAARALLRAVRADGAREAVALSTCNRTELYAVADDLARVEETLCEALVAHTLISRPELECARYEHREERVASHLFRVVSSLDSMVLGESEIQGQVREAFELAAEEGAVGAELDHLFRQALEVGKRVRHETRIGVGPASVSAVAVQLARQAASDLPHSRVLLIGAGQMAEGVARALAAQGDDCAIVVCNRTVSTARALADRIGGTGVGFDRIAQELAAADVVISSTEAPHLIIHRDDVERALAGRPERPMVLIDIAVPRDLDPDIAGLPGASLHDIDDLERVVEASMNGRVIEAQKAERLVAAELRRFVEWRRGLVVTPTISSLRARAEEIRRAELRKLAGQWESLSERDRERVEALTKAIVNKLLHEPTVRAREAAMTGDGLRELETLRQLFGLGVGGPAKDPSPSS